MGKAYPGLYECTGHVVLYLVVVKVGKATERSRPRNHGKQDSQMLVMYFLNKVHFNTPVNPLELEIFHQIKNVIGVSPTFYKYLFMVDADTTVDPFSVIQLISVMIHDNAKQSLITMMQVYECFISYHMAKAFESLLVPSEVPWEAPVDEGFPRIPGINTSHALFWQPPIATIPVPSGSPC
ncbi:hypothetical protein DXG01_003458 [Tephrocybe rancida]|nr:hypothetical protein DXG01_003458 [Tephrocybe rancida]